MFKFQSLLELDNCQLIINTIRDPLISSFTFELLLQQLLKQNHHVLLVLLNQNLKHYNAVLMKCGINLKNFIDKGSVQVIDCFDYGIKFDPVTFLSLIEEKCSLNDRLFVLIDDIQVLETYGLLAKSAYTSMLKILNTISHNKGCLFVGVSLVPGLNPDWDMLINNLVYKCDVWFDCDKPETGYSQQINGLLKCFYQHEASVIELNYKISNRNVTFTKL